MENRRATIKKLTIRELLKPHVKALTIGFIAVVGEGVANLLEPWPLKIVLDSVLRSRPTHGWLNQFIQSTVGADKLAILKFACAAVLGIAVLDAISSYTEKYFTTSVGQWVMHDLRRTLYSHIQQLSLSFHDQKRTGDLISRVTSDIDSIQSFITSALLGALINIMTLVGMIGVMFYLNWRFTLIALSVAPVLFVVVYSLHAPHQEGFARSAQERRRDCFGDRGSALFDSCGQGLCPGGLRAAAPGRRESRERGNRAARTSLKAKLSPLVDIIVAVGTCLVLWFGARLVLSGSLSAGSLVVFILYLGKMYKPMQELSKMTDAYSKALVGYERIQEVLETERRSKTCRARSAPHDSRGRSNSITSISATLRRTRFLRM